MVGRLGGGHPQLGVRAVGQETEREAALAGGVEPHPQAPVVGAEGVWEVHVGNGVPRLIHARRPHHGEVAQRVTPVVHDRVLRLAGVWG